MKNLYGIMGFIGFIIMIGAAGGADSVSFFTCTCVMALGFSMILLSLALTKHYKKIMRRRRQLYFESRKKCMQIIEKECVIRHRKTPAGISGIISGKINSPELC